MDFSLSSGTPRNLLVSLTDASDDNWKYSDLSITTTPDPLSGFVMTISLRRFNRLIAVTSVLGGFGPTLNVVESYRA